MYRQITLLLLLSLGFGDLAVPARAQTATGTILGTVKDQTGAVVPGAMVRVANAGTNVSTVVTTSEDGNYSVPNLIPGEYWVSVELTGFKKVVIPNLTLQVNQSMRVDASLDAGQLETIVEVNATGTLIETDSSTVGKVVENKQIVDLPLLGRNFLELTALSPGTVHDSGGTLGNEQSSFRTRLSGGAVWVGGARAGSISFMIDGVENNDPGFQTPSITPPIDAIQEFKLMSKNYTAEFGGGAAQINVAIKSGTNSFHGTVYDFLRNDALNARNFFAEKDPITGRSKPVLRYNQFGGSLGGPVVLPRLINGKNKLFFFVNYEGTRVRSQFTSLGKFPTPAELSGDFANSLPIYDPDTGTVFPGNRIPTNRINPKSKQLFFLFPQPNVAPQPGFNTLKGVSAPENVDQLHVRVDYKLSDKDSLFVRTSVSDQDLLAPSVAPFAGLVSQQKGRNIAVSYIRVLSSKAANEFRLGFNRPISLRAQEGAFGDDLAGSLFKGTDTAPVTFGTPSIGFADFSGVGSTGNGPLNYVTNSWSFVDGLTLNTGNHTLKSGVDLRNFLFKEVNAFRPRGFVSFTGLFTSGPQNPTGNAIADFLLGLPLSAAVNQGNFTGWYHGQGYNFYLQDDWKIHPRITLNWGIRYEYRTPLLEEGDRVSMFDPTYPGGRLLTPNKQIVEQLNSPLIAGGISRGLIDPDRNNWAPRIGFAFRPSADNRSVVRAGYGIFYDTFEFNEYIFPVLNAPWQKTSAVNATRQNPIDFASLFPTAPTPVPVAGTISSLTLDRNNRTPYVQQWNLNVQREIGTGWVLEAGYLGSKSTKLSMRNQLSQGRLVRPGPAPVIERPYYNFGFILIDRTEGYSNYHAFISRAEKRFRSGIYFLTHYTFGKTLGLSSGTCSVGNDACLGRQNVWDLRNDYGLLSYDVTHRLVVSGIWELPFGRSKRFGSTVGGAANKLIAGWQLNGLYQIQSGFPFSILARDVSGTGGSAFPRADLAGDPKAKDPADPRRVFNRSAFAQPQPGTFGNSGRNILRGEGLNNFDLSLFKNTYIGEKTNVQFRAEFFNVFNHTQFGPFPGTTFSLDPASSFGVYRSTQHDARVAQLALKIIF